MPSYHFVARSDLRRDEDLGFMAMLDDADARAFARGIIRDLMHTHPAFYRTWTIDISEDERAVASIPFAEAAMTQRSPYSAAIATKASRPQR